MLEGLDGSLLSIWGTSSKDVWTVGGSLGNGLDALVLRFDGAAWTRLRPGGQETYWWVHGTGASDVWLVGEKGRITHWDGASFREDASGTDATLFGAFAVAPDDVWAVGGTPDRPDATNDVVLHFDGASRISTGRGWTTRARSGAPAGKFSAAARPGATRNGTIGRYGPGTAQRTLLQ